ncbi:MAG: hypothetical protein FWG20_02940 [Candidatus Cloacimonetes bacterium]|nr:hypothetical protein [Candidatus Cloacimonadota bacterium]
MILPPSVLTSNYVVEFVNERYNETFFENFVLVIEDRFYLAEHLMKLPWDVLFSSETGENIIRYYLETDSSLSFIDPVRRITQFVEIPIEMVVDANFRVEVFVIDHNQ